MQLIKKRKFPTVIFMTICSLGVFISGIAGICMPSTDISLMGRGIALGITFFFGVLLLWGILEWRNTQAGISISDEGFLDQSTFLACGFVPWANVKKITIKANQGHCYASFTFHDPKAVLDQSPGKFAQFINLLCLYLLGSPIVINMQGYQLNAQEIASLLESTYGQIGEIEFK